MAWNGSYENIYKPGREATVSMRQKQCNIYGLSNIFRRPMNELNEENAKIMQVFGYWFVHQDEPLMSCVTAVGVTPEEWFGLVVKYPDFITKIDIAVSTLYAVDALRVLNNAMLDSKQIQKRTGHAVNLLQYAITNKRVASDMKKFRDMLETQAQQAQLNAGGYHAVIEM